MYYGLKTRFNAGDMEIVGVEGFADAKYECLNSQLNLIGVNMGMKNAKDFVKWVVAQTDYFVVAFPTYPVRIGGSTEFKDAVDAIPDGRRKTINRLSKTRKNIEELMRVAEERLAFTDDDTYKTIHDKEIKNARNNPG